MRLGSCSFPISGCDYCECETGKSQLPSLRVRLGTKKMTNLTLKSRSQTSGEAPKAPIFVIVADKWIIIGAAGAGFRENRA